MFGAHEDSKKLFDKPMAEPAGLSRAGNVSVIHREGYPALAFSRPLQVDDDTADGRAIRQVDGDHVRVARPLKGRIELQGGNGRFL